MRLAAGTATVVLAALSVAAGEARAADPQFADWQQVQNGVATGTLLGHAISLSGTAPPGLTAVSPSPPSVVDGSSPVFASSFYTPPLATSDALDISGTFDPGSSYTLTFGAPVQDPVLHLFTLASKLAFPAGTRIERVSGDSKLRVDGSDVIGQVDGSADANGTVRLLGTFTSIPFNATATFVGTQADGIEIQVGGTTPPPPPPVATATPAPTSTAPAPANQRPAPVPGVRVVTQIVSGQVTVKLPNGQEIVPTGPVSVPVGATVDARKGVLAFESAADTAGHVQSAMVSAGIFRIRQTRAGQALTTDFLLTTPPGKSRACASRAKGVVRKLTVATKGVFRTVAAKGVATGRNATWTMADRCDGTLTSVRRGKVSVRAGHRTVRVRPGHSLLIRARLFAARRRR